MANTSDVDVPKVMSTSYGEDEDSTPLDYAKRINVEFMKAGAMSSSCTCTHRHVPLARAALANAALACTALACALATFVTGARGISLLFASGDSGAAPATVNGTCMFESKWPAASPYVTAVGGTAGFGFTAETVAGTSRCFQHHPPEIICNDSSRSYAMTHRDHMR